MEDLLKSTTLRKLTKSKRQLVEVPYTATVAETLQVLRRYGVSAVAVASPQADGFNCEHLCDGDARRQDDGDTSRQDGRNNDGTDGDASNEFSIAGKRISCTLSPHNAPGHQEWEEIASQQYAGIASAIDIFDHFAKLLSQTSDNSKTSRLFFAGPVHQCIKCHTLCILSPNISVLEAMDKMMDGLQSAIVPYIVNKRTWLNGERKISYFMITPTDIIKFLHAEAENFKPILRDSVDSLQAYQPGVLGLCGSIPVGDAMKCMHEASLAAVPVLDVDEISISRVLIPATGKLLAGTFSASDLQRCDANAWSKWADEGLLPFLKRTIVMELSQWPVDDLEADEDGLYHIDLIGSFTQFDLVCCTLDASLHDVIKKALQNNVHRVWVIEAESMLLGVISFEDIFKVVRRSMDRQ